MTIYTPYLSYTTYRMHTLYTHYAHSYIHSYIWIYIPVYRTSLILRTNLVKPRPPCTMLSSLTGNTLIYYTLHLYTTIHFYTTIHLCTNNMHLYIISIFTLVSLFHYLQYIYYLFSISRFTTSSQADDVAAFFSANPLPSSERRISQAVESIRANAALLERIKVCINVVLFNVICDDVCRRHIHCVSRVSKLICVSCNRYRRSRMLLIGPKTTGGV